MGEWTLRINQLFASFAVGMLAFASAANATPVTVDFNGTVNSSPFSASFRSMYRVATQ